MKWRSRGLAQAVALVSLSSALCLGAAEPKTADAPWVSLFNGRDLTGWKIVALTNPAPAVVEDGAMVLRQRLNTVEHTFVASEREYDDFILELDLKDDPDFNSGILLRCVKASADAAVRLNGYQVKVDNTPRAWTGGVFDDFGDSWTWLHDLADNERGRAAFKLGEWAHFRIECIGPTIKVWVNGVPTCHLVDEKYRKGSIAFKIHSVGNNPKATQSVIRLKNIRIITERPERYALPMELPPRRAAAEPGKFDKAKPRPDRARLPAASERARLIVLADMGNEPDEEQQMLHLLMCANEFDVEGLIAVTGKYLRPEDKNPYRQKLHPELFTRLIEGYAKVYPNLKLHAAGWPTPEYLHGIVASGQPGYGIAATGEGKASAGSKLIIDAVTKADARPVHIVVNAGANTLAQALRDYRATHSEAELKAFVAKLRVFENGAQDNSGAWICHEFPDILWVRSNYQTYCFGGPSNDNLGPHNWKPHPYGPDGQDEWAAENVRTNHGALGELYPVRRMGNRMHFLEGGGTIPWMGLVCHGLTDSAEPSWGGWSGRFSAERLTNVWSRHSDIKADEQSCVPFSVYTEAKDRWTDPEDGKVYDDSNAPIWRWRTAMWNDFKARMDWCVQPYAKANHAPQAVLNGDRSDAILKLAAKPGDVIEFTAAGSTDPDQNAIRCSWGFYPEAGRRPYGKELSVKEATAEKITVIIPPDASGKELHLILEVWDRSEIVPLVAYRRAVINVAE